MNFRYAYANAFSRFSEAIQDYLANIDNTPDPSITKEHFVEELDKAHETLFNFWLSGKGRISFPTLYFFVSTTDGAGVAAVSILDKEHCNWAIRGYFSARIFYLSHGFDF